MLRQGNRKARARYRLQGVRTSKVRCLRLMHHAGLLAPSQARRVLGTRFEAPKPILQGVKARFGAYD
ncbi:hypothetical protein [Corallococcus terminator]|uniref:Uncharacterized protein n=1 Tax=Corallococcus terminator TaxID=2316733 RepID=A0A3A8JFQ9_9BACT|nr:hypothetical protein D7V88_01265 [Corallococcus terminator]